MKSVRINRLSLTAILATVVCLLLLIPGAYGQFTLQVTEDRLDPLNQLNGVYHPGTLQNDPGPGGLALALTYTTPAGLQFGDLLLHEPVTGESDLIRWNNNATLVFYSDIPTEPGEIPNDADIGLPNGTYGVPFTLSVTEVGLVFQPGIGWSTGPYSEGGMNGFIYVPTVGQPGYNAGNPGNPATYIIISDVPEPGTVILVGVGLMGLLAFSRRQRA
jgi:hypothetical protein